MATPRPTYRLTITETPAAVPGGAITLRRLLKVLLRSFGYRAVKVEELPAADGAEGTDILAQEQEQPT